MIKKFLTISLIFYSCSFIKAQNEPVTRLSLAQVIEIAQNQSPEAFIAKHRFRSSYWEYRAFKAQFMPQLGLNATIPSINQSIKSYTSPDGREVFIDQSYTSYQADLSLSKVIGLTGGSLYVRSRLQRIDDNTDTLGSTSYLSNPVTLGFVQPIFGYNPYKWSKDIDPVKYEEACRKLAEDNEQVALTASNYFFNLLLAQMQKKIAEVNVANYDTLYRIAQGRYNMGTIAENELLQLELNLLRSRSDFQNSSLDVENAMFRLKSFLRLKGSGDVLLEVPSQIYHFDIPAAEAIDYARSNRSGSLSFERRLLEAARDVNRAKTENRFSADLFMEYGLSKNADELPEVYKSPNDHKQLALGIKVPILDWGLSKGRIKMAESTQELIRTSIEQEQIDFDQEVYLSVMQFSMQKVQMQIAAKSDTVANKSFKVAKARYMIGKISITDLNLAQQAKDQAHIGYISALQKYWRNYFTIRQLTLFDFRDKKLIQVDINKVL